MDSEALAQQVGSKLTHIDRKLLKLIGIEILEVTPGRCVARMTVRDDLVNSANVCQGGIIFTLADQAFAYASLSSNYGGATLSANIIFTHPAPLGDVLTATAAVSVDSGGRTSSNEVIVTNQDGQVIAKIQGVWVKNRIEIVKNEQ